jgi:hypothetical protein
VEIYRNLTGKNKLRLDVDNFTSEFFRNYISADFAREHPELRK